MNLGKRFRPSLLFAYQYQGQIRNVVIPTHGHTDQDDLLGCKDRPLYVRAITPYFDSTLANQWADLIRLEWAGREIRTGRDRSAGIPGLLIRTAPTLLGASYATVGTGIYLWRLALPYVLGRSQTMVVKVGAGTAVDDSEPHATPSCTYGVVVTAVGAKSGQPRQLNAYNATAANTRIFSLTNRSEWDEDLIVTAISVYQYEGGATRYPMIEVTDGEGVRWSNGYRSVAMFGEPWGRTRISFEGHGDGFAVLPAGAGIRLLTDGLENSGTWSLMVEGYVEVDP